MPSNQLITVPNRAALPAAYKWWVVLMLWFVCFLNYADRQSLSAVFPVLEHEFGFNKEQLGLIGSAFMWTYAGGALFAGLAADRCSRKGLILGGCLFWSAITAATGWCGKFWQFIAVRTLTGCGETFYFPAAMSMMSDYHSSGTRSRALSFHQSGVYAGTILGSWFGAWLAMHYGWQAGFYFFGAAGILVAVVLGWLLREPQRGAAETTVTSVSKESLGLRETFKLIFRSPAAILLMLAFICANAVATVFLVWTPSFLTDKFHYDLATAGLGGTVFIHSASFLAVPVAGLLADRLAHKFAGGRVMIQAAGLVAGAIFVFLVGHTGDTTTLILSMTAFGLCKGFYDSGIFASLYDHIEPRARGTAAGIMNTVGWGGGAFGPWLVGHIAEHGARPTKIENMSDAISWGGALYLIGAALLVAAVLILRRPTNLISPSVTLPTA